MGIREKEMNKQRRYVCVSAFLITLKYIENYHLGKISRSAQQWIEVRSHLLLQLFFQ